MSKQDIVDFFGGREATAAAMGISGRAVEKWPDPPSQAIVDRAAAVGVRVKGLRATRRAFPGVLSDPLAATA